ncbi:hypothetical protein PQX77_006960 [Marasmius sp. AFHP31]|nr:hypothetical protein PQX77_006960 [Marasmius sp. AFHP31]
MLRRNLGTSVDVRGTVLKQGGSNSTTPLAIFVLDFNSKKSFKGKLSNDTSYKQQFYFNSPLSAGEHSLTMTLVDPDNLLWLDYIDYAPSSVTNSPSASSMTTDGATATNQSQNNAGTSSGVSKGLVAGISVLAAMLTALTVLGLVWWFLQRRKRAKKDSEATRFVSHTHPSDPTSPVQSYFQSYTESMNPPDEYRKSQIPSRHVVNQSTSVSSITGTDLERCQEASTPLPPYRKRG